MIEDFRNENTIYSPVVSHTGKEIEANQPKNFSYPKRKFGKEETTFLLAWYESGPAYIMTKLNIIYFASFAKKQRTREY